MRVGGSSAHFTACRAECRYALNSADTVRPDPVALLSRSKLAPRFRSVPVRLIAADVPRKEIPGTIGISAGLWHTGSPGGGAGIRPTRCSWSRCSWTRAATVRAVVLMISLLTLDTLLPVAIALAVFRRRFWRFPRYPGASLLVNLLLVLPAIGVAWVVVWVCWLSTAWIE